MVYRSRASLRVLENPRDPEVIPSAVLGMLIFVMTEVMLFAGLVSAHSIVKSGAIAGWPPPGQPRLPVEATAFNSLVLLASGVVLWTAGRRFKTDPLSANAPLAAAIGLGAFFVLLQGWEWVQLIAEGLTLTSSTHGSFFYLIVGIHALHAIAALSLLGVVWTRQSRGELRASTFGAARVLWFFVVVVWPVLYVQVYL